MIQLSERIWIGNSDDERHGDLATSDIGAVLNVAQDLHGTRGWLRGVEYTQVGLIDGPGNIPAAYTAAVLGLSVLLDRHERILVVCHNGLRSLAVVMMYLIVTEGRVSDHPSMPHYWKPWGKVLDELRVRTGLNLPEPHEAHRDAADNLPYGLLEQLL